MDTREAYNLIAADWHKDHQEDSWWIEGTEKFISFLPAKGSVLDAGCGTGSKSKYLSGKGLNVLGIDFSEKMIEIAKREVPASRFVVLDMMAIDEIQESFDGIFFQASLLHIPKKDVPTILAKAKRKLNPGGCIYVAVKAPCEGQAEEAVIQEDDYGYPYERFFSYFSQEEMERLITDAGFEIQFATTNLSGKTNWVQVIGQKN